jgi:myo-inositol-1(or 4)-monophosphatase
VTRRGGDAASLLALAVELASAAGRLASEGRRAGLRHVKTKSSATDMVTEFDGAAERLIVEGLAAARPDDGIVGEEGTTSAGTSGVSWYVDPIDGTTNYLYGIPQWGVSIGVADRSGMLVGVVVAPDLGETFTATRGGGAHLNGDPIAASELGELSRALVATGFSYAAERRGQQGLAAAALLPHVRDLRRFGSASLDLCAVACGRVDLYYETGLNSWDMAAGDLIAREAGAVTSDFAGGPARPEQLLACAPALGAPARRLLAEVGALPS